MFYSLLAAFLGHVLLCIQHACSAQHQLANPIAPFVMNEPLAKFAGCSGKRVREFFIDCTPPRTTHQSGQVIHRTAAGKPFIAQNAKAKNVANTLIAQLSCFAPSEPFTKPTRLEVFWQFPFRKSDTKKARELGMIPCTARPDADNLAKLFLDAMGKAGFFKDDALVYDFRLVKVYAARHGINVKIEEIEMGGGGSLPLVP